MAILNAFWLFLVISPYVTLGYFSLFHLMLFSTIVGFFWLLYVIFSYCKLFQFKILLAIINYFWLLKVISPYVIIDNFRLL
jgi:hypothetical protein